MKSFFHRLIFPVMPVMIIINFRTGIEKIKSADHYFSTDIQPLYIVNDRAVNSRNAGSSGEINPNRKMAQKDPLEFSLTREEKVLLLKIARETLSQYIRQNQVAEVQEDTLPAALLTQTGAFITITDDEGNLRGCIGNMKSEKPLYKLVQGLVIASATRDRRFLPVTAADLSSAKIEISVLTPMKKIGSIDEIILGRHGIYLKKGSHSGTFLPKVADSTDWSVTEFLGHCARDKARIGWNGWKKADIFIYEALVFDEREYRKK